jgi:hypothetical protein
MIEDRIQIDGIWYVKEEPIKLDPTHFEGYAVENDDFCFESIRTFMYDVSGTKYKIGLYSDIDIKCVDKRDGRDNWKEHIWDNNKWMIDVLENDPDSLKELPDMGSNNIQFLQAFLQHLKDKGWLC